VEPGHNHFSYKKYHNHFFYKKAHNHFVCFNYLFYICTIQSCKYLIDGGFSEL